MANKPLTQMTANELAERRLSITVEEENFRLKMTELRKERAEIELLLYQKRNTGEGSK